MQNIMANIHFFVGSTKLGVSNQSVSNKDQCYNTNLNKIRILIFIILDIAWVHIRCFRLNDTTLHLKKNTFHTLHYRIVA